VDEVGACHCTMCLRWASGPFLELDCGDAVAFEGEENIVRYKSSDWAERGFCGTCGANLFYYLLPTGEYMMSAGAFDDQSGLKFTNQVFIDEKPDWYAFANETKNMTGAEVFALYAPKDGDPA
ncbi:MAG: GFA family protein, partial [Alphaproteobacteria bacterium]